MPGMKVDLYKNQGSSQLNRIFFPRGLRGILEAKEYRMSDIVFPFDFGCVDT